MISSLLFHTVALTVPSLVWSWMAFLAAPTGVISRTTSAPLAMSATPILTATAKALSNSRLKRHSSLPSSHLMARSSAARRSSLLAVAAAAADPLSVVTNPNALPALSALLLVTNCAIWPNLLDKELAKQFELNHGPHASHLPQVSPILKS